MMISPNCCIDELKDKSYKELLIDSPSPKVIYQMNLEYLGKLCKLISKNIIKNIYGENKMQKDFYEFYKENSNDKI